MNPNTTTTAQPADAAVRRARIAVVIAFLANGLAFATLIARTPSIRDTLGLSSGQLGLLLLCLSGGAVAGLPLSGPLVSRSGPARGVLLGMFSVALGLALVSTGLITGIVPVAAVGLAFCGLGSGIWDVSMNVEGADVERRLGRSLMPRLHAAFSIGTVAGAAIGAAAAGLGLPLSVQLLAVAVVLPIAAFPVTRAFLGRSGSTAQREEETGERRSALAAWREPRTLLIGLLVLGFAFTEGSANDWIAIAFVDGYGGGETLGAVAFGFFVSAMTVGRMFGGSMLERYGRVAVLRATALLAVAGLLLVLLGGSTPVALVGALLWGVGASLGFPVGMSAAADDPAHAAARVSVVSSVGYTAFLAGPPLIGLLAEHSGILRALFVVLGALVLGLLAVGAARPLPGAEQAERAH
ncbi:MFS transporter [Pseudonocardia humida]|uniref:MFS transporter n=1 Tax=Pseudonocardia humida TaxID=2800819 RepID=A0ABT1A9J4_9PSEU|nr:MFS transporter [Pseudonocardia humida]MCO1659636.1 MFS transporter [Pseudonocardia humida]